MLWIMLLKKNQHAKDEKISDGAALIHTNQCNR